MTETVNIKARHKAREIALQILYRYEVAANASGTPAPTGHDLLTDLNRHFDHFKVSQELREFASQLVAGTLTDTANLDALLEKHAANWRISRMGFIDRSLLRMATYEMIHFPDLAPSIVIDEAIELAKHFGTAESPSFVNGILDAIKGGLNEQKAAAGT